MKEKVIMAKDPILTQMAKTIFGNIVKQAYVCTWDYNSARQEISGRIDDEKYTKIRDVIDIGGKNIRIDFANGKNVYFTNSEWGSISSCDRCNFREI